jgi:hypothetical protein
VLPGDKGHGWTDLRSEALRALGRSVSNPDLSRALLDQSNYDCTGGSAEMGSDLNVPMNPTEYFQLSALRRYLRDPASVRAWPEQKMPSFGPNRLSEAELDAVITYLAHVAKRRPR